MGSSRRLLSLAFGAVLASSYGCASGPASTGAHTGSGGARPLAHMVGRRVLVLPVQYLASSGSAGFSTPSGGSRENLALVDEAIALALSDRGLGAHWSFAPAIVAAAARSPGMIADPRALSTQDLRKPPSSGNDLLGEVLASQLRGLGALRDSRYVLLPVELRLTEVGDAEGMLAALRLYLIDTRTARIQWTESVEARIAASSPRAVAAAVAARLAELVAGLPDE